MDLDADKLPEPFKAPHTAPAWIGTVLAKTDRDLALAAGLAAYERVVALENKVGAGEQVELSLFRYRAEYLAAKAREPKWRTESSQPADAITKELDRSRLCRLLTAQGVLASDALCKHVGRDKFVAAVDDWSRANAGRPVTTDDFLSVLGKGAVAFHGDWQPPSTDGRRVSVSGWVDEPEDTLVVYGTAQDAVGNEAAAKAFQHGFRIRWTNITIPAVADKDVTDEQLKGKHLILIGRPAANTVSKRFATAVPATFGDSSVTVAGKLYVHERTAVAAAGVNPLDKAFGLVILGGLSADSTYHAAVQFAGGYKGAGGAPAAEVVVYPQGRAGVPLLVKRDKGEAVRK